MRALKRAYARIRGEIKIAPRRRIVARTLQTHFGLPAVPDLVLSGSRGHDSIYKVRAEGRTLGMLRLVNPYRRRKTPAPDMPFISVIEPERAGREAAAYQAGSAAGLTPQPLWQDKDALCCAYLPLSPLHDALLAQGDQAWRLVMATSAALQRLHALGVVHADASLANTLADDKLTQIVFVDFEYLPAPHISAAAARLYDYLRLLESTWKFMPENLKTEYADWIAFMAEVSAAEGFSEGDLAPLLPALPQLSSQTGLFTALRRVLSGASA
ncbi:MAG: hypothetical protein Q8K65_07540 [Alphaproteobacteria bacterium]|nr:hypothetical protein [Alphaproteobacteria bacterium]